MSNTELWQRLQIIAMYAGGVFCTGTIAETKREQLSLHKILRANPEMFEKLYWERPAVYRLTFVFYTKFGLPTPKQVFSTPSLQEILKSLTWGAFIIQENMRQAMPDRPFLFGDKVVAFDQFEEEFPGKINGLITIFDRSALAIKAGYEPILPRTTLSKWVSKLLSRLCAELSHGALSNDSIALATGSRVYQVPNSMFLVGAVWPERREDCHQDARKYEGIDKPIEGAVKWSRDKMVLETAGDDLSNYANYKFGVYRI